MVHKHAYKIKTYDEIFDKHIISLELFLHLPLLMVLQDFLITKFWHGHICTNYKWLRFLSNWSRKGHRVFKIFFFFNLFVGKIRRLILNSSFLILFVITWDVSNVWWEASPQSLLHVCTSSHQRLSKFEYIYKEN